MFQVPRKVESVSKSVEQATNGPVQIIDGLVFIVLLVCSIYNSVSMKLLMKLFPQPKVGNGLSFIWWMLWIKDSIKPVPRRTRNGIASLQLNFLYILVHASVSDTIRRQ